MTLALVGGQTASDAGFAATPRHSAGGGKNWGVSYSEAYNIMLAIHNGQRRGYDLKTTSSASEFPGSYAGQTYFDLGICTSGTEFIPGKDRPANRWNEEYLDLAYKMMVWRTNLSELGYPSWLWADDINNLETTELNRINRAMAQTPFLTSWYSDHFTASSREENFERWLAGKLDRYWQQHSGLVRVVVEGGCGGDTNTYPITTNPPGGHVNFIPVFFFEKCRLQNINPYDMVACNRWRAPVAGRLEQVAGTYYFTARWNDGSVRQGQLDLNLVPYGQTVVINR